MLRVSAVIFCILFAFMIGVIAGAKKERHKISAQVNTQSQNTSTTQKSLEISSQKKNHN